MACYIAIITLEEIPIYVILDKKRVQKWPSLSCTVKLGLTAAKLKKNFWPPKGSSLSTALMVCISCRKERIRAITFLWVKQEPYMSFRNILQIALYRLSRLYLSASVHSHACTHTGSDNVNKMAWILKEQMWKLGRKKGWRKMWLYYNIKNKSYNKTCKSKLILILIHEYFSKCNF